MKIDDLISDGSNTIQELVRGRTEETNYLEFKQKRDSNSLDLHKDDRRSLGEAISGFANAEGGLLIIGIKTERPDGVDRAKEVVEISNVAQVAERYRAYAKECIRPPIDQIRVEPILTSESSGILAVDIPKGLSRPHMSMAPGHQKYYRRVSDRFEPMMHYEIDEMMRLRSFPVLSLHLKFVENGRAGENVQFSLLFGLENNSNSTAKFPFISYSSIGTGPRVTEYGLDGNGRTLWQMVPSIASANSLFAASADQVIHPKQALFVSKLDFLTIPSASHGSKWAIGELDDHELLTLKFEFGCEDMPMKKQLVAFSKANLLQRIVPSNE